MEGSGEPGRACGSEALHDHAAVVRRVRRGSEVLSESERAPIEAVDSDAVAMAVDDGQKLTFKPNLLGWFADDLEDGLLDTVTNAFADFRDAPEPSLPLAIGGTDVVGDQELHQVTVHGT